MIIRIMNENQYIVPSIYYDDINKIDNEIVKFIAKEDKKGFMEKYMELIDIIRKNGVPMDPKTLKESDLIVPPADITFEEAKKIFVGEGLIPG
jgi:hypothetical protein